MPFSAPEDARLKRIDQAIHALGSWVRDVGVRNVSRTRSGNASAVWDAKRAAYALLELAADLEADEHQLPPP